MPAKKLFHFARGMNSVFYSLILMLFILSILFSYIGCDSAVAQQPTSLPTDPEQIERSNVSDPFTLAWDKTYGDNRQDTAYAVAKTNDGYIIAGDCDDDTELVKTDLNGSQVWRKTYGGTGKDSARSVIAVSDGYIVAGSSSSYENWGTYDVYLLKVDLNGKMVWYKAFSHMLKGHLTNAYGKSVAATGDGYVIVGDTNADINDGPDILLIKTDLDGNMVWNKTIGGDAVERGNAIIAVSDGYIIAGDTYSYGNRAGASDVYLVKTDLDGNVMWSKTFGGKYDEVSNSLAAVDDGYVIVGSTKSYNERSRYDIYLVKTDLNGNLTREMHYGVADDDLGKGVIPVSDGYVITGYTSSTGNLYKDVYVLKTDFDGDPVWNKSCGGTDMDEGNAIVGVGDGFAIAGYTCTYGIYTADYYLLKFDSVFINPTPTPTAEPTEAGPSVQAGGLSLGDMWVLAGLTVVIIVIAGAVVAAVYFFPKK